jgi:SAM-dependent methyltransferase
MQNPSAPIPASPPYSADQIKVIVREFLSAHFNVNDWYLGAHIVRFAETLAWTAPFIRPTDRVLEAGSYGHIPLLVWRLFGPTSVYAYNLQAGFIGFGQGAIRSERDPRIEFQCHIEAVNIERDRWPQMDNNLDAVLCFEVLEHLREHPMFMLAEANRVLKRGGYFILTTPNSSSYRAIINILYHENPFTYSVYEAERGGMGHIKEYATNELRLLFENSGFEVVTHKTFSPYKDEKDSLFPELRVVLRRYGLVDELSGSTHFLVARKTSRPNYEYYEPLYNITKTWSPSLPPWTVPPNVTIPGKKKK